MEQIVLTETEAVDDTKRGVRSLDFCDRHRAIERDDRTRRHRQQLIVELQDLPPVSRRGDRRIAVDRIDRRLDLIRARPVAREAAPHDGLAFCNQVAIPELTVLVGQSDERAAGGRSGASTRFDEQHQCEQSHGLRLARHQLSHEASQADRLLAEFLADQAVTGARRVALVEDQIHDREYGA